MILEGLHEKDIISDDFPFRVVFSQTHDFHYPVHWHNAVEFIYCMQGSCIVEVNGTIHHMTTRDILVISAGDIHGITSCSPDGKLYFLQSDYIKLLSYRVDSLRLNRLATRLITASVDASVHTEIEKKLLRIISEQHAAQLGFDLVLSSCFIDIAACLLRMKSSQDVNPNETNTADLARLDKAFKFIRENYAMKISLADAAASAGFSTYHFSRYFKKATGENFNKYLSEYRLRQLETLMLSSEMSITEAAFACGFNSLVTFNRIFKSIKGCSPSDYLKLRDQDL